MNELYIKIAALCDEKHITMYKLCKDISLSQGAMTDLKNGRKQSLSVGNLAKIARYFDVSVDYLNGVSEREPYSITPYEAGTNASLNVSPEELGELAEVWNVLKDRPEAKMLFKSANSATAEQLIETANYLDYLKSKGVPYEAVD